MSDERFQKTMPLSGMPGKAAQTKAEPQVAPAPVQRPQHETSLDELAAPIFDLVLQMRSGAITPSNDVRVQVDRSLKHLEERGQALRYKDEDIAAVKFALAAFVDETVLTANFPMRHVWEKYPLQLEYFGEHLAGVKFFERLEQMMKKSEENGEVIELYYLCLLLGFKGRYNIYFEQELKAVIKSVADELRRIGRLVDTELSPHWRAMDQPPPQRDTGVPIWAKIGGGITVTVVFLLYVVLYLLLRSDVSAARQQLLR